MASNSKNLAELLNPDSTVAGDLDVTDGTIKLDGNYPVGTGNVALGDTALDAGSLSGNNNTAIGSGALTVNTTGERNTTLGYTAGANNSSGNYNVYLGSYCADQATGSSNVAVGDVALRVCTGARNVAIGADSMNDTTSGSDNTAVGYTSLDANVNGNYNVAIGGVALGAGVTASTNTAIGYSAFSSNTAASYNTAVGFESGKNLNTTGNTFNTFVGMQSGFNCTVGSKNTYVGSGGTGYGAGYFMTTGSANTILGAYNGNQDGLDIRVASNNIVLSDGDGNPRQYFNSGTWFIPSYAGEAPADTRFKLNVGGYSDWAMVLDHAFGSQYFMSFRYGSTPIGSILGNGSSTSFNTSSDYRLKENVVDLTGASDRVQQLAPKRFNFIADADKTVDGFLAHEVADIVPEAITGEKDAVDDDGNIKPQAIDQSKLVPLLTAALQEALTKINALETQNAEFGARIATLEGE
jgi:hypothetical protein